MSSYQVVRVSNLCEQRGPRAVKKKIRVILSKEYICVNRVYMQRERPTRPMHEGHGVAKVGGEGADFFRRWEFSGDFSSLLEPLRLTKWGHRRVRYTKKERVAEIARRVRIGYLAVAREAGGIGRAKVYPLMLRLIRKHINERSNQKIYATTLLCVYNQRRRAAGRARVRRARRPQRRDITELEEARLWGLLESRALEFAWNEERTREAWLSMLRKRNLSDPKLQKRQYQLVDLSLVKLKIASVNAGGSNNVSAVVAKASCEGCALVAMQETRTKLSATQHGLPLGWRVVSDTRERGRGGGGLSVAFDASLVRVVHKMYRETDHLEWQRCDVYDAGSRERLLILFNVYARRKLSRVRAEVLHAALRGAIGSRKVLAGDLNTQPNEKAVTQHLLKGCVKPEAVRTLEPYGGGAAKCVDYLLCPKWANGRFGPLEYHSVGLDHSLLVRGVECEVRAHAERIRLFNKGARFDARRKDMAEELTELVERCDSMEEYVQGHREVIKRELVKPPLRDVPRSHSTCPYWTDELARAKGRQKRALAAYTAHKRRVWRRGPDKQMTVVRTELDVANFEFRKLVKRSKKAMFAAQLQVGVAGGPGMLPQRVMNALWRKLRWLQRARGFEGRAESNSAERDTLEAWRGLYEPLTEPGSDVMANQDWVYTRLAELDPEQMLRGERLRFREQTLVTPTQLSNRISKLPTGKSADVNGLTLEHLGIGAVDRGSPIVVKLAGWITEMFRYPRRDSEPDEAIAPASDPETRCWTASLSAHRIGVNLGASGGRCIVSKAEETAWCRDMAGGRAVRVPQEAFGINVIVEVCHSGPELCTDT